MTFSFKLLAVVQNESCSVVFCSLPGCTSSEEKEKSEEKQAVQTPPDTPSTHQLQEVHSERKEDFMSVHSGPQGTLTPRSLLSFDDLSRFVKI